MELSSGEQQNTSFSTIKRKTCNPVWNEDFAWKGTLGQFIDSGLSLRCFDSDMPAPKPDKDDPLGSAHVELGQLRGADNAEVVATLSTGNVASEAGRGLSTAKHGTISLSVRWEPPDTSERILFDLIPGEVRDRM